MTNDGSALPGVTGQDVLLFEQAYCQHFACIRNFLRVYVRNAAVTEDLAQDTFLQFWLRPDAFDASRASLRTYLLGIARKKGADWWRRSQPSSSLVSSDRSESQSHAFLFEDALARLDPDLRNALWLREAEGYSYQELAGILDIPLGTVRSRLHTAREQLRCIWTPDLKTEIEADLKKDRKNSL